MFITLNTAKVSWDNTRLYANDFADIYFQQDAIAESEYHFLHGNQLPTRFATHVSAAPFVVAETGFGTGLNFLLTADLFLKTAKAGQHLHYLSAEKYPLCRDLLQQLYQQLFRPRFDFALLQQTLAIYPPPRQGIFSQSFQSQQQTITLSFLWGDAYQQLSKADFVADAWFLDGFAPQKNTDLWSDALFALLAQKSQAGTTFATFTAASHVRKALLANGFVVEKQKGFGKKRERLIGYLPAHSPTTDFS